VAHEVELAHRSRHSTASSGSKHLRDEAGLIRHSMSNTKRAAEPLMVKQHDDARSPTCASRKFWRGTASPPLLPASWCKYGRAFLATGLRACRLNCTCWRQRQGERKKAQQPTRNSRERIENQ
jgi:hypothetical protein